MAATDRWLVIRDEHGPLCRLAGRDDLADLAWLLKRCLDRPESSQCHHDARTIGRERIAIQRGAGRAFALSAGGRTVPLLAWDAIDLLHWLEYVCGANGDTPEQCDYADLTVEPGDGTLICVSHRDGLDLRLSATDASRLAELLARCAARHDHSIMAPARPLPTILEGLSLTPGGSTSRAALCYGDPWQLLVLSQSGLARLSLRLTALLAAGAPDVR